MLEFVILYVNDDAFDSSALELPESSRVISINNADEALSIATDQPIKLIILAERLSKGMSGNELCDKLAANALTASIPILFLSNNFTSQSCENISKILPTNGTNKELQKQIFHMYTRCKQEYELLHDKNLVLSIVNKIHSPIFIITGKNISFANQYFLDFFDISALEDFSKKYPNVQDVFEYEGKESSFFSWIKQILNFKEDHKVIIKNFNQERMHVKIRGELLKHSDEYLIITQDITAEESHAKDLEHSYNTDPLTMLPNRLQLIKDLKNHNELALAILDIDSFKVINDFYGHIIGDFVIKEVAIRISRYISHENLCFYRLHSDSFAILNKEHIEKEYFEIIIISIIQIIAKSPFIYKDKEKEIEIFTNLTAGLVFENESVLAHANLALREAKSTHQDYIVYHPDMKQEIAFKNNMEWVQKIKTAIAHDKIVPYFQPIINNSTQEVEKYECLVRLIDEEDKVISPYFFLDIAKHSKLYESITKIMIKKSFQTFTNSDLEFSINLSIEDIVDYNLFGYIKSMLSIYPLADQVCFELLETEKIEDYRVISDFVTEVRALGCKVSIDDFGSGYSNFSHLLNLNFDYLKIDASLIKGIHEDKNKQTIVKTIVTFAKELGIKTIAEFVESKEIYEHVTQMGIDFSQGYYFSVPVESIK